MAQKGNYGLFSWFWLPHLPMVFFFLVSALAETNRPPFDLPEAEAELVAGYQVEYTSTPYLLFMIGELSAVLLMTALMTILFLVAGFHLSLLCQMDFLDAVKNAINFLYFFFNKRTGP